MQYISHVTSESRSGDLAPSPVCVSAAAAAAIAAAAAASVEAVFWASDNAVYGIAGTSFLPRP